MYQSAEAQLPVAAVRAAHPGILALVLAGARPFLVAALGDDAPTADSRLVLEALSLADGEDVALDGPLAADGIQRLDRWLDGWRARQAAGNGRGLEAISIADAARRGAIRRIAAITARAPAHRRHRLAALASAARIAVTGAYGIGVERVLADLVAADLPDEAWLVAMEAFASLHGRATSTSAEPDVQLGAMLLLVAGA